jgi:hypothetical protein
VKAISLLRAHSCVKRPCTKRFRSSLKQENDLWFDGVPKETSAGGSAWKIALNCLNILYSDDLIPPRQGVNLFQRQQRFLSPHFRICSSPEAEDAVKSPACACSPHHQMRFPYKRHASFPFNIAVSLKSGEPPGEYDID